MYTKEDIAERDSFVERTIAEAHAELQRPYALDALGDRAIRFAAMLESTLTPEITAAGLDVPEAPDSGPAPLPIIALRPGEAMRTKRGFMTRTARQQAATLSTLQSWRPLFDEAYIDDILKALAGDSSEVDGHIEMLAITTAKTITAATVQPVKTVARAFAASPQKGVIMFKHRPCVTLGMDGTSLSQPPYVLIHELCHVEQNEINPVVPVHSSNNALMQGLRLELEAYRDSSFFVRDIIERHRNQSPSPEVTAAMAHVLVELVRQKFNSNDSDRFRPSGALLADLKQYGLNSLLHEHVAYDQLTGHLSAGDLMVERP